MWKKPKNVLIAAIGTANSHPCAIAMTESSATMKATKVAPVALTDRLRIRKRGTPRIPVIEQV
jgi:hypothetical protein